MNSIDEEFHELVNINNENDAYKIIIRTILSSAKKGELDPDKYLLIEDDGLIIGNYSDFDSDVLYYAIKADDVVDFDTLQIKNKELIRSAVHALFI
jgi:hypothetical protein